MNYTFTITENNELNIKQAWICPRCGIVNAPFIEKCDCQEYLYGITN